MDIQLVLNVIGVILTSIEVVLITLATIFAVRQLKENTRVRQVDVIDRVFEYASLSETRRARERVRGVELPSDLSKLSTEQRDDFELVLSGWARVGALLELGVFSPKDKDLLFQTYSLSIDSSWTKLKSYVDHQRQKTGVPDYWRNVELLAKQAHAWREAQRLPTWSRQPIDAPPS